MQYCMKIFSWCTSPLSKCLPVGLSVYPYVCLSIDLACLNTYRDIFLQEQRKITWWHSTNKRIYSNREERYRSDVNSKRQLSNLNLAYQPIAHSNETSWSTIKITPIVHKNLVAICLGKIFIESGILICMCKQPRMESFYNGSFWPKI